MRPVLPEKKKNYKLLILYIMIFVICVIGIGMSMYMQYFQDEKIGVIFGVTDSEYEDKYNELKNNFNSIFTNDLKNLQNASINITKIREDYDFVVTRYNYNEQEEDYTLDVSIPNINIDNEPINGLNSMIIDTYKGKVDEIKSSTRYIYTVKYKAYIQDNILSLIIYSELKEKSSSQKIMIETYNYDLVENKIITLEEMLKLNNITVSDANNKIINEIKQIQEKNDTLSELGYNTYKRDLSADMYDVANIEQYFRGEDGNIYVIFPYGNFEQTSEMDIIIFMNNG